MISESRLTVNYMFSELPLYLKVQLSCDNVSIIDRLNSPSPVAMHCIKCSKERTFLSTAPARRLSKATAKTTPSPLGSIQHRSPVSSEKSDFNAGDQLITSEMFCAICHSKAFFVFLIKENIIQKIGQNPSIKDMDSRIIELKNYFNELDRKEIITALGLHSHGIGIGSFVYMRRVIERLVDSKMQEALSAGADLGNYEFKRFDEKVEILKEFLPSIFIKNRRPLYGILSKAIHELDEKFCLDNFDTVYKLICLIAEENRHNRDKEKLVRAVEINLSEVSKKLQTL